MATMAVRAVAAAMAALAVAVAPHDGAPIDVAALPEFLAARSRHAAGAPNDTLVLQAAIDKAAMGAGGGVVLLREGQTFVSWPLQLRSNIKLVIDGTLATNGDPHHEWVPQGGHHQSKVALLWATSVRNLTVTSSRHGLGHIDGNGSAWWPLRRKSYTFWAPEMFSCVDCSGVRLTNFNVTDSPAWCLENSGAVDFLAENLTITAPHDSPNTDGIGIDCTGSPDEPCIVRNCVISNGDDEVAVGGSNVLVEDSHFSNGHGASIGSLGYNGSSAHVSNITFRNLVFNHTATTMRIKTWQGGHGLVKNVTYENITVHDVGMPIRLTQFYCPGSQHKGQCPNLTAVVRIEDVTIRNVSGTHSGDCAGQLLCSDTPGSCKNLRLENVHLSAAAAADVAAVGEDGHSDHGESGNWFECWNAHGSAVDVTPPPCVVAGGAY